MAHKRKRMLEKDPLSGFQKKIEKLRSEGKNQKATYLEQRYFDLLVDFNGDEQSAARQALLESYKISHDNVPSLDSPGTLGKALNSIKLKRATMQANKKMRKASREIEERGIQQANQKIEEANRIIKEGQKMAWNRVPKEDRKKFIEIGGKIGGDFQEWNEDVKEIQKEEKYLKLLKRSKKPRMDHIKCPHCKSLYKSNLERCPTCGALNSRLAKKQREAERRAIIKKDPYDKSGMKPSEIKRMLKERGKWKEVNYGLPSTGESDKQMKEWEEKRGEEKKEKGEGGTGKSAGIPCPECGSTATEATGKKDVIWCPVCNRRVRIPEPEGEESAISNVIHSSFTTIIISVIVGLLIPIIFGSSFDFLGTMLIGLGIIFLGFSRI